MRLKFFRIPVEGGPAEAELGAFLAAHKVLEIDRQFASAGANSYWAICIAYLGGSSTFAAGKNKIDYREVLTPREFDIYTQLRNLRKNLAERDAVPAYAIFTNEQLAAFVRQRVTTAGELAELPGVGPGRGEKYGALFLEVLRITIPKLEVPAGGEENADRA